MPKDVEELSAASVGSPGQACQPSARRDMDENTTGDFVAVGIALAILAFVIFTLPMPPRRRRH